MPKDKPEWRETIERQYYGTLFDEDVEPDKDDVMGKAIKSFMSFIKDKRGFGLEKSKEVV